MMRLSYPTETVFSKKLLTSYFFILMLSQSIGFKIHQDLGFGLSSLSLSVSPCATAPVLLFVERANVFPENPLAMRIVVVVGDDDDDVDCRSARAGVAALRPCRAG